MKNQKLLYKTVLYKMRLIYRFNNSISINYEKYKYFKI